MAVSLSTRASATKGGRGTRQPMSEINVTPFVDVMLVLLIIFMVTAPLLAVGVPVNLPDTSAPPLQSSEEALTVTIGASGEIYLQETLVTIEELVPRLLAIADEGYEERIYVRGDKDVDYGAVMKVMGRVSDAGFSRIGLVTDSDLQK